MGRQDEQREAAPRIRPRHPCRYLSGIPASIARKNMTLKSEELTSGTKTEPAAHSVDLRKTYGTGQATVHALAGVSVTFERGRFTAVMGPSGSGKSTLMQCMAAQVGVPAGSPARLELAVQVAVWL